MRADRSDTVFISFRFIFNLLLTLGLVCCDLLLLAQLTTVALLLRGIM